MSTGTDKKGRKTNKTGTARKNRSLKIGVYAALAVMVAVIALGAIFFLNSKTNGPSPKADGSSSGPPAASDEPGQYAFEVGSPGPGEEAPPIKLPSTDGGTFDLSSMRGQTVLLYFQEGLMCQACWDQLKDMEAQSGEFEALGIDETVSITDDPLVALEARVEREGFFTPILSDEGLAVSKTYDANKYGMMGDKKNGHTFVVVGPDGEIQWRADYGGAPDYTMYVPVPNLLADMREGLDGGGA